MENSFENPMGEVAKDVESMREAMSKMIDILERHDKWIKELQWKLKEKDNER